MDAEAPYDAAVLDWGIGGFGFVREYRRRHPSARLLYISDSGSVPYGKMARVELRSRVETLAARCAEAGALCLVVACNAASSALTKESLTIPTWDVVSAGLAAVRARRLRRVAVVGGRRTISSGAYAKPLRARGLHVVQRVAQPLSALIEAGITSGPRVEDELMRILGPVRGVEALLLGCTHYPAVSSVIARLRPDLPLIDPIERLAADVPAPSRGASRLDCVTTGGADASRRAARRAFGVETGSFVRVRW